VSPSNERTCRTAGALGVTTRWRELRRELRRLPVSARSGNDEVARESIRPDMTSGAVPDCCGLSFSRSLSWCFRVVPTDRRRDCIRLARGFRGGITGGAFDISGTEGVSGFCRLLYAVFGWSDSVASSHSREGMVGECLRWAVGGFRFTQLAGGSTTSRDQGQNMLCRRDSSAMQEVVQ
jgi:hypothetical protein